MLLTYHCLGQSRFMSEKETVRDRNFYQTLEKIFSTDECLWFFKVHKNQTNLVTA